MTTELAKAPAYRHTMHRLEEVKRVSPQGADYWTARDIHLILGYPVFDKFLPVIKRAEEAFAANGIEPSHHIAQTSVMMKVGKGAQRRHVEYFLSRGACYLIAMNGDPTKPEIAGAQAYFAAQTRAAELAQTEDKDRARLANRERLTDALRKVSDVAKDIGVQRYSLFHAARWHGLYDAATIAEIKEKKGLKPGENLLSRAGSLELAAHAFQSEVARERILQRGISGEAQAIQANFEVAQDVRALVIEQSGVKLEDVPLEAEPIESVQKRLRAPHKRLTK